MRILGKSELKNLLFNRIMLIVYLFPFIGGFVLYYFHSGFSVCLLINLTGLPCPACGLTRAFQELSHLHFIESLEYNLSVIIIAPILLFLITVQAFPPGMKKKIYFFIIGNFKTVNLILGILLIIFFAIGFLRILDKFIPFLNFRDITPEKSLFMLLPGVK